MGGKGGGSSESTIRWAPYVEAAHIELIEQYQDWRTWRISQDLNGEMIYSPYKYYTNIDIDTAFFGAGLDLSSITALYDVYEQLITNLDLTASFNSIFADVVNGAVIDDLVSAEASQLSDDLEQVAYPRFECGLRDINSVISTSFVMGRAVMEQGRTKAIARFSAEMRYRLLPLVIERWKATIDWNKVSLEAYANILKFYLTMKEELEKHQMDIGVRNSLWPFTILEYERAACAALAGPQTTHTEVKGASTGQQIAGGVMMGLSALMMVGA